MRGSLDAWRSLSIRETAALAFRQHPKVHWLVRFAESLVEALDGTGHAVVGQGEGSEVGRDGGLHSQNALCFNGLLGRHVHRAHEPFGLVCADREERQADRVVMGSDLREVRLACGVPGLFCTSG